MKLYYLQAVSKLPTQTQRLGHTAKEVKVARMTESTHTTLGNWQIVGLTLLTCAWLSGCGSSQNWQSGPATVSIGGTVSGLTQPLTLTNNGVDPISVRNGTFQFDLVVKTGATYAVAIQAQPSGQTCSVQNGSGTATQNVTNVTVTCINNPTIGGTVAGLTGTLVLQNNASDTLTITSNGAFQFARALPLNSTYFVAIQTQPQGQTCALSNGSGTVTGNVTNVSVTCTTFTIRPLPAIYHTSPAINYSPYRAGGPGLGEVPSNTNILQDLTLLHSAGYKLLRLFGADQVSQNILTVASQNFPDIQFQLGAYLEGAPSSCADAGNSAQLSKAISLANSFTNVATVSIGNETSFAANLPVTCLAQYIQQVRAAIQQPVTADDDYTFYAGFTASGERPATILPLLDFVSIHIYPFLDESQWNWQQSSVATSGRAAAMMNAALSFAQQAYGFVANMSYTNAAGHSTTIGASLPIVIGETGWKAVQTNPQRLIETDTANPVNAKWYIDLMSTWRAQAGAPLNIFIFEGFDEAWKNTDDGWGLWDANRNPRYALCGINAVPNAPTCTNPLYSGAGYHQ
jgi:exo-beta-1,3-glucanase (GH17 family)